MAAVFLSFFFLGGGGGGGGRGEGFCGLGFMVIVFKSFFWGEEGGGLGFGVWGLGFRVLGPRVALTLELPGSARH